MAETTSTSGKVGICPFKVGDTVRRAPGTLGADGSIGTVLAITKPGDHIILTVGFINHMERFVWDTYVSALSTPTGDAKP